MDLFTNDEIQKLTAQIASRGDVTNVQIENTDSFVRITGTIMSEGKQIHATILYLEKKQSVFLTDLYNVK